MRRVATCAVVAIGCAGGPRYLSPPAPLAPVGPALAAEQVVVELHPAPWWTAAGTADAFILALPTPDAPDTDAVALGGMRSANVPLTIDDLEAVRCAFMIVPIGDPRPCAGRRDDAIAVAGPMVDRALDDLRVQAGAAGVGFVGRVRCFARRYRRDAGLWCEGEAQAREPPAAVAWHVPGARPVVQQPDELPSTRLALVSDASGGLLGRSLFRGADLGLRYRPVEVTLHVVALSDERVGLGGGVVGRWRFGDSLTDALVGVSATSFFANGATNPDFDGVYAAFIGVGAQTRRKWFFRVGQPYVSLRVGALRGDPDGDGARRTAPMVELRLGLSTPER